MKYIDNIKSILIISFRYTKLYSTFPLTNVIMEIFTVILFMLAFLQNNSNDSLFTQFRLSLLKSSLILNYFKANIVNLLKSEYLYYY